MRCVDEGALGLNRHKVRLYFRIKSVSNYKNV